MREYILKKWFTLKDGIAVNSLLIYLKFLNLRCKFSLAKEFRIFYSYNGKKHMSNIFIEILN